MINFKKILTSTALVSLIGIGSSFAVTKDLKTPEELKTAGKVRIRISGKDAQPPEDDTPPAPVRTESKPVDEPIDLEQTKAAESDIDLDAILNAALAEVDEKFYAPTVTLPEEKAPIPALAIPKEEVIPQKPTLSRRELKRQQQDEFAQAVPSLVFGLFSAFAPRVIEKAEHSLAHRQQEEQNFQLYGRREKDRHIRQRQANKIKYGRELKDSEIRKLIRKGELKEK